MTGIQTTGVRCPMCGMHARVHYRYVDASQLPHATIERYECPSGCGVDDETIRQLIGAQ